MSNISFNVACPSCEAKIAIRSTATVGRKIECPKCKFRFVVEAPAADPDDEADAPASAADDTPAKGKGGKGKKKKKKDAEKGKSGMVRAVIGIVALLLLAVVGYFVFFAGDSETPKPNPPADGGNKGGGGRTPAGGAPTTKATEPGKGTPGTAVAVPPVANSRYKDVTNLLPGEATTALHLRMDDLGNTPLRDQFFDPNTRGLFKRSMGLDAADLEEVVHSFVGTEGHPFIVLRTRSNYDEGAVKKGLKLEAVEQVRGKAFQPMGPNPFLNALGRSLGGVTRWLNGPPPAEKPRPGAKPVPAEVLALHLYDERTIIITERTRMERFLHELDDNNNPPFLTELTRPEAAPAAPAGGTPPPGGRGGDPAAPPAPAPLAYTSNPTFRTVKPELKKAMNALQEPGKPLPAFTLGLIVDEARYNHPDLREHAELNSGSWVAWAQQVKVAGLALTALTREKLTADAYFEYLNADDAKKSAGEHVLPALKFMAAVYKLQMDDLPVVKDVNTGAQTLAPAGLGRPALAAAPAFGQWTETVAGRPADAMQKAVPGETQPPPRTPEGGRPTPEQPPAPGAPAADDPPSDSHADVSRNDNVLSVKAELFWKKDHYQKDVIAGIGRFAAQLKGRMAILGGEMDWSDLASALPKAGAAAAGFPRGTLAADAQAKRFNLPPAPEHRVGFLAELLPFIGRKSLRDGIQEKKFPWHAAENRAAAETWVPEFLVPSYDPAAWRATSDYAPDADFGATNYIGLAGWGLDAARYNPNDPAQAKLVGMYGYDWQSQAKDVTDGLSNTIALIQVPPTMRRPWIAGGGATLAGVDDKATDPLRPFVVRNADGKRGVQVLMADGSARWIREGTDPKVFKALVTRAGGDTVADLDKVAARLEPTRPAIERVDEMAGGQVKPKPEEKNKDVDAKELKALQGRWKSVRVVAGGMALTDEEVAKAKMGVIVEGSKFTLTAVKPGGGRDDEECVVVKLDPKPNPKHLDIKDKDGDMHLIAYDLDGDSLRLVMKKDGKGRPAKADATTDKDDIFMDLIREK